METKHTPGPWSVFEDKENETGIVKGYNVESAAGEIVGCEGICGGSNDEANARLIAAAPDLLEAVDRLLTWNTGGQRAEDVAFARQAYAKAVGMSANTEAKPTREAGSA